MNSRSPTEMRGTNLDWTRISSFKPYLAGLLLTAIASASLMIVSRNDSVALTLVTVGTVFALALIALNYKVVHRRENEYRVTTLFYAEIVKFDDVCMTVSNAGRFWTCLRIHLCRPARFGWRLSFVPASRSCEMAGVRMPK